VWWEDSDEGHLALLLAYLFTRTDDWRRARLRVCVLIEDPSTAEQTEESLRLMLESVRIPAEVKSISGRPDLVTHLGGATLVAVPAHLRKERIIDPGGDDLFQLFEQLPLAVAVMAGAPIDLNAGPESPEHSELLMLEERAEAAEGRLERLERQLEETEHAVIRLRSHSTLNGQPATGELEAAEEQLAMFTRRTLKARAVAERARADLQRLLEAGALRR
jgi:hypothetical protein